MNPRILAAILSGLFAATACQPAPPAAPSSGNLDQAPAPAPLRKVRFLLNSGYSGANSWFLLADQRGYFREEGLEVEFVMGRGAFTAAGRVAREGYDIGYGDVQAVIEENAKSAEDAPVAVYMVMSRSPSAIILPAASPVSEPKQLQGLTITGHGTDVALNTFAQYAERAGIDAGKVRVVSNDGNWKTLLGLFPERRTDALFGYITTTAAAVRSANGDVGKQLKYLRFRDVLPEFYGSTLMMSRRFIAESPEDARAVVRAVNRGVLGALCEPEEAIQALLVRDPGSDAQVELARLLDTAEEDMGGKAAALRDGVGDIVPARMQASIELTSRARRLPSQPTVEQVFRRDLLPPLPERQGCDR